MSLEILTIPKRIGGGIFTINADNNLFHMKTPKILFTITQPSQDGSGKYDYERAFLDIKEVNLLIRGIKFNQNKEVMKSFKGGFDKKLNKLVARIFKAERNEKGYLILSIELADGIQTYTTNKYNQKVPGVVKPAGGGKIIKKGSIALTRDESLYLADMLDKELTAWRTVLNFDFMSNKAKYDYHGNNNSSGNNNNNNYNNNNNNNYNNNYNNNN